MFIEVHPTTLLSTSTKLSNAMEIAERIIAGSSGLSNLSQSSGTSSVSGAIEDFTSAWCYGLTCLKKDATTLARMLDKAGSLYRDVEDSIVKGAGG